MTPNEIQKTRISRISSDMRLTVDLVLKQKNMSKKPKLLMSKLSDIQKILEVKLAMK